MSRAKEIINKQADVAMHCFKNGPPYMESMHSFSGSDVFQIRNEIERLEKEVAELKEWRPIETAPKDGTKILVSNGAFITSAAYGSFTDASKDWKKRDCWCVHDCDDSFYSILFDDKDLTKWMPLPELPK